MYKQWMFTTLMLLSVSASETALKTIASKALRDGLKNCAVTYIYDRNIEESITPNYFNLMELFTEGYVSMDVNQNTLQDIVKMLERKGIGGRCNSFLMVLDGSYWSKLLDFIHSNYKNDVLTGHLPMLVVLADYTGNTTLVHPATRKLSQLVVAQGVQNLQRWKIFGSYIYSGNSRQQMKIINYYSSENGFSNDESFYPTDKFLDLQGYQFTIAALTYSPFIMNQDVEKEGPGKYTGLEVYLIDTLARHANFTYVYKAPSDGEWGRRYSNGTWTGMIGLVDREEADWAVSDITFSPQRARYVDFSIPFVYDASELLTPRALPLPKYLGTIKPFTIEVWISLAVSIILVGPLMSLIVKASTTNQLDKWFENPAHALIYSIQPIFMRGNHKDVEGSSSRIFAMFWLLYAMTVSITYSSSLTSFLILPGYTKPIQNLEELVASDIGWGKVNFGGVQNALLEQTRDPILIKLREGVQWRSSLDDILQDVVSGTLATWDNKITTRLKVAVYFTDNSGQPLLTLTGFELLQERIAWPMTRNSPFKSRFDEIMRRATQAGLVDKWLKDVIREQRALATAKSKEDAAKSKEEGKSVLDSSDAAGTPVVLSLDHFQGAFIVFAIGCLAATLTLLVENLIFRLSKKKTTE